MRVIVKGDASSEWYSFDIIFILEWYPVNMTVLGQWWLVLVLFWQYIPYSFDGTLWHWASAGFIAAKLYVINGTDPEPGQFWNSIGKPLRQDGTLSVLGQLRADCANHNGKTVHSLYWPSAGLIAANHYGKTVHRLNWANAGMIKIDHYGKTVHKDCTGPPTQKPCPLFTPLHFGHTLDSPLQAKPT